MPTTTTTTRVHIHSEPAMCFRAEPKKYYYHQEYIPVRQVHHPHHHHGHGHHHHHHHSTSPVPRGSYTSVRHSHSPRVSTSSHHRSGPVVYQSTSKTRYYN